MAFPSTSGGSNTSRAPCTMVPRMRSHGGTNTVPLNRRFSLSCPSPTLKGRTRRKSRTSSDLGDSRTLVAVQFREISRPKSRRRRKSGKNGEQWLDAHAQNFVKGRKNERGTPSRSIFALSSQSISLLSQVSTTSTSKQPFTARKTNRLLNKKCLPE